jgi:predicted amino acid dehydrogenase
MFPSDLLFAPGMGEDSWGAGFSVRVTGSADELGPAIVRMADCIRVARKPGLVIRCHLHSILRSPVGAARAG